MDTSESKTDMVNHPPHYQSCSLECIDMMRAIFGDRAVTEYCTLNAFKYLWRHNLKGKPDEDLKKADWYIKRAQMYNCMFRSLYLDHSTLASMQSMINFWQYKLSPEEPDLPDLKIPEELKAKNNKEKCEYIYDLKRVEEETNKNEENEENVDWENIYNGIKMLLNSGYGADTDYSRFDKLIELRDIAKKHVNNAADS